MALEGTCSCARSRGPGGPAQQVVLACATNFLGVFFVEYHFEGEAKVGT